MATREHRRKAAAQTGAYLAVVAAIVVVIAAIVGPRTRRAIVTSIVFFVVFTLQVMLPGMQDDSPWLAAFHPLLALAVLGLAVHIGMPALSRRRAASAPRPAH